MLIPLALLPVASFRGWLAGKLLVLIAAPAAVPHGKDISHTQQELLMGSKAQQCPNMQWLHERSNVLCISGQA